MPYDKKSFILGLATGLATRGVLRNPAKEEQQEGAYLTFSSTGPFTLAVNNATKHWDGTLEYSTDTTNWTVWDGTTTLASGTRNSLYLRGSGNTVITGTSSIYGWTLNGSNISCDGDIRTLLDYTDPGSTVMSANCYSFMFRGCTNLTAAPALPATTLANNCYYGMFSYCTNLTVAPELPATTLAVSCYAYMFRGCTNLTVAPALPATTLANRCYEYMFTDCTGLMRAPTLPATILANNCYYNMFRDCINIITITALPATTLKLNCYGYMFSGCKKIKISTSQTDVYKTAYRIPLSGAGITAGGALTSVFGNTGGTFKGTPTINTTYYTSNEVV